MAKTATVDARLDHVDTQLERISAGVIKRFDRLEAALEKKADKEDVMRLLGAIDAFAKRQEIDQEEWLVMGRHLGRLDRWVHELADNIGVSLST